jgi:hypothetical protein
MPRPLRFLLLLLLTFPSLGAEIAVSPGLVYGEAHESQRDVSVASDGSGYLAVWHDQRAEAASPYRVFDITLSWTLMGSITSGGSEPAFRQLVLSRDVRSHDAPVVIWAKSFYVVLWTDGESRFQQPRLMAMAVDREGTIVVPPAVIAESVMGGWQTAIAAASNGSRTVVAYRVLGDLRAMVLDSSLRVLEDVSLNGGGGVSEPSVATNGDELIVVWGSASSVWAVRFDADGTRIDPLRRGIVEGGAPVITANGTDYLLTYRTIQDAWRSARMSPDRTLGTRYHLSADRSPYSVVWTGTRYIVAGARASDSIERREIFEYTLDADGRLLFPGPVTFTRPDYILPRVALASNGSTVLTAWSEPTGSMDGFGRLSGGTGHHITARLSTTGTPSVYLPPRSLSISANAQKDLAIARGGDVELAVWREDGGIFARRIAANGSFLDASPIVLDVAPSRMHEVAFDGKQFVVGWLDYSGHGTSIRLAFVSPSAGVVVDRHRVEDGQLFDLAAGAEGALLTYLKFDGVYARLIRRDTPALLSAPVRVHAEGTQENIGRPSASWNGSAFLITWPDFDGQGIVIDFSSAYFFQTIRGVRVSASLVVMDAQPKTLADAEAEPPVLDLLVPGSNDPNPSLASDGQDWLLVWKSGEDVRARRITKDGVAEGPSRGTTIARGLMPEVAWDGAKYLLAWKTNDSAHELRYGFVPRDGALTLLDGRGAGATRTRERLALSVIDRGRFSVAYARNDFEMDVYGAVPRAYIQRLAEPDKRRAAR